MTEQKVKKRGWVKNAAIIFLSVMLVLTFFSNTIMKHSLPEVAAQYVQSGAISAKIRGTGTVTANESYEVKCDQTREVLSVPVKVGDEVKVGDTLILFGEAESKELEAAQKELDDLMLKYQQDLIDASGNTNSKETLAIKHAQEALDRAKADRVANVFDEALLESAKRDVTDTKANVDARQAEYDTAQANLDALGGKITSSGGNYSGVTTALNALNKAKSDLESKKLLYGTQYDALKATADAARGATALSVYMDYLAQSYSAYKSSTVPAEVEKYNQYVAYTAISDCEDDVDSAQQAYDSALNAYYSSTTVGNEYEWNRLNKIVIDAKAKLTAATKTATAATDKLKELQDKKAAWQTADNNVYTCQIALDDATQALEAKQKTDSKTQLSLDAERKQIAEKKADLTKLQTGGEGADVKSKVNGKVASINVSAGKTTTADSPLMTIEVPDMGYGLSFSVTTEQSKKVALGDAAEVTNYYGGDPITATLVGIKSDPQNPGTNKILNFKLQGTVESGSQLSIALGERGGSYETIVPNSSIRSDSNGKFVLAVISKNSPLGNRYIATRIDVQVLATDDVNSAVSGGLTTSDFVITTSTKPIEPGTQVRLADDS
ncbi:MAG: HlyD family efflux transporter periplasmic adaptor subunit [Oscillospiraceae bacterium]